MYNLNINTQSNKLEFQNLKIDNFQKESKQAVGNNLTYPEKRSIEFKTNNGQLQVF